MSGLHESLTAGARHRRPLTIAFALVASFMLVEVVAGWLSGSLALVSDAGHMATDAVGLGMALAAVHFASRSNSPSRGRSYGIYRVEILAALANAALLFAVAGYVVVEAIQRLADPPEVLATPMMFVALIGLLVNIVGWRLLREGSKESLNVEGAYVEVMADLIGSIGVLVAAVTIYLTGWSIVDPLMGAAVAAFILPRAWRLGRKAIRVLIQAAPSHLDLDEIKDKLESINGVVDAHDLHVWTLTSGIDIASTHLRLDDRDEQVAFRSAREVLDGFGISHATVQVERSSSVSETCSEENW